MLIYEFKADTYNRRDVLTMKKDACEEAFRKDFDNVQKYEGDRTMLQYVLNEDKLDIDNCFYRVFDD